MAFATVNRWEQGYHEPHGLELDVYQALDLVYVDRGELRSVAIVMEGDRWRGLQYLFGAASRIQRRT